MNLKTPQLSIIIPTWNTADITLNCINSIQKYLPKTFFEIIVIDNASADNTSDLFSKNKNIIYVRNSENLGFSKACNIGVKYAKSDYLLFLNSDMELVDSSIVDMLSFFQKNSNCGLVGPQFLNPDKSVQGSVFPPQTSLNAFREFWLNQKSYSKYFPAGDNPLSVWAISGGAVLIKKELFEKIGGWNEKYFMYYEDLDLCRQIRKSNLKIYYYPKCKLIHRHGASGANLANSDNQWRRLIPSSILYHGYFNHKLINFIIWSGQKIKTTGN